MIESQIFVIDDDPLAAKNLAASLAQEAGHEIETFSAPEQVQARMGDIVPDAVILSIRSGMGDGLGLLAQLRARDPDIVIVAMTPADDDEATAQVGAVLGPLYMVSKPCDMSQLLPRLRAGLDRQRLHRELYEAREALARRDAALKESAERVEVVHEELRSTHTELRAATERLLHAEQLAAVGRVASGIAYELSRQLALVGYAEAMKSRLASDPELVELADIIIAAQKRLSAMVDEIRDFAAAEGGKRLQPAPDALDREPADIAAVVDEALAILRYDKDVRARVIERRYQSRPLAALHYHKFSQVVINLVSNAVLATDEGAVIVLELSESTADDGKQFGVLTVTDRGEGMPPEVLERLGEPFFTTRGDRGSGLGVGICMRIVEEHGGTLTFQSKLGEGTVARVAIPLIPRAYATHLGEPGS